MGDEIFSVYLTPADYSKLAYAKLELPASPWELLDALDKARLPEGDSLYLEIIDYHDFEVLRSCLTCSATNLPELNDLAERLSRLDERQHTAFEGLVRVELQKQEPLTLKRLRDLAASADCCHVVESVVSDGQLGRFYAENGFVPEVEGLPDAVFELLDFEKIGEMARTGECGVYVPSGISELGGYVVQHSDLNSAPEILLCRPVEPDYARVSSDSEDQVNSYIAQVDFYSKHIAGKEEWEMVDIYADEGISGLEARNRDEFNRMMVDCREGKIDRVLCKSISRFARNTQEYIQFVRELLRLGISIHFEKENIDTGKMTSEQIAQIYGAFAQMESTSHSSNMRFSVRVRMENGLFIPPSVPYGYRLTGRDLEIVPEEAAVVCRIFSAYLSGQGKDDIAKELNQLGVDRGRNREKWYPSTVAYILTNISYTGNMIWQKSYATDTIPFQQVRNRGQKPRYFVEHSHPAIVSSEDFQRVQKLMSFRNEQFRGTVRQRRETLYSKRIYCGECGSLCRKKVTGGKTYWVCRRHDSDKADCPIPQIPELEITAAVLRLYHKLKLGQETVLRPVLTQLQELRERELRSNRKISDSFGPALPQRNGQRKEDRGSGAIIPEGFSRRLKES